MKSVNQKIKCFRRNAEFIFAIGFQTVFCGTYFCDWNIQNHFEDSIFVISGQNHKNKFRNNLFRNNLWSQKFLPLR